MKGTNTDMKKTHIPLTCAVLALAAGLIFGVMGSYSASAKSGLNSSQTTVTATATTQTASVNLPNVSIYALTTDNMLYILTPGASNFISIGRVRGINGNLIGIDFRPAEGGTTSLYGLTDTGRMYLINVATAPLTGTLVSNNTPRFAGGFQSLLDFNPVANALRVVGSNDQNYAFVNSNGGNLNATAVQTSFAYAANDVNGPKAAADGTMIRTDPNIAAGSYTNNIAGATVTIFYGIDYDLDTLVTIAPAANGGSSATGGGQLTTIGPIVDTAGNPINFNSLADFDIYSRVNGENHLAGINNETVFTIALSQINASLASGAQKVVARTVSLGARPSADAFIDIACARFTTYQAEDAAHGGGNREATNHINFTGTGFVDFANNVAGGFTEFTINQTGNRTILFRYANGSTNNRLCNVTVNGVSTGTLAFPPTGSFDTWGTVTLTVNLGATAGSKLRLTSATANGGPNLDRADVTQ